MFYFMVVDVYDLCIVVIGVGMFFFKIIFRFIFRFLIIFLGMGGLGIVFVFVKKGFKNIFVYEIVFNFGFVGVGI